MSLQPSNLVMNADRKREHPRAEGVNNENAHKVNSPTEEPQEIPNKITIASLMGKNSDNTDHEVSGYELGKAEILTQKGTENESVHEDFEDAIGGTEPERAVNGHANGNGRANEYGNADDNDAGLSNLNSNSNLIAGVVPGSTAPASGGSSSINNINNNNSNNHGNKRKFLSPTANKLHKLKAPTSPNFKNFFSEINSPSTNTNNNESENDHWLRRISKFNHYDNINPAEWKENLFKFNKRNQNQTNKFVKGNSKAISRKDKASRSDKAAGDRANLLLRSLFLGYTASNLVSSVFFLDEHDNRRSPILVHLIDIKVYEVTEDTYPLRKQFTTTEDHLEAQTSENHNNLRATPMQSNRGPDATVGLGLMPDNSSIRKVSNKKRIFRIDLEYGVGPNRAKWSLVKSYKEIAGFSNKLRLMVNSFNNGNSLMKKELVLPEFPKMKKRFYASEPTSMEEKALKDKEKDKNKGKVKSKDKGKEKDKDRDTYLTRDSDKPEAAEKFNGDFKTPSNNVYEYSPEQLQTSSSEASPQRARASISIDDLTSNTNYTPRPKLKAQDAPSLTTITSRSSIASQIRRMFSNMSLPKKPRYKQNYTDYSEQLEKYFYKLFLVLALKPQSNRLFQFFELSPIGILLSNDHGYRGKQGYLLIATSAKKQGWRVGHLKARDLGAMIKRHTLKWFCIRDSYIVYVADINSTTILDVFLVDEMFKLKYAGEKDDDLKFASESEGDEDEEMLAEETQNLKGKQTTPHFNLTVENKERKMKMVAKSAHELNSWIRSIKMMHSKTEWSMPKRFNSFAPIRNNCMAQWFVDARDYWYAASSAILMAKDVIFIHDWWLSPELYMRRPANGNQEYRIDRLLKKKAEEGVKIFIIIYRNIGDFVPIDSSWTKHSLLDLHENIRVMRSPNQFLQNTFFWAHHEKLLIIDHTIAFLGGIDLCYGRYDTPDHVLVDDSPKAFAGEKKDPKGFKYQIFPGKDYSNPRVQDFFELNKPYESMYDRQKVPRMPWHDVHMVTAGQVARDLCRHFVQRWNYLIRQKRPSRPTPLLTPPSNLTEKEIEDMGFKGTCEIQLLRSSGYWSLGLKETEHSIQNAYLKMIETSEHFVYLENQFFVTACAWDNVVITNRIGDALVDRIIRAHQSGTKWKAMIVIPLMPGFESQVDEPEGSSVRLIMQCQYMSISRGSTSIYAKLRKVGIDPDDYIQFYSLRKWGKIGEFGKLVSEQLYIHSKVMIVDDRIAIIGSANINERSMCGNRDSEICAIIRDTSTVTTRMNNKPYVAAKFAHTLRMRLMREHLGVHVDELELVERKFAEIEAIVEESFDAAHLTTNYSNDGNKIRSAMVELATREVLNLPEGSQRWKKFHASRKVAEPALKNDTTLYHSFNHRAWNENAGIRDKKQFSSDPRIKNNESHKADVNGMTDNFNSKSYDKSKLNARQTLKKWAMNSSSKKFKSVFVPDLNLLTQFLEDDETFDPNATLSPEAEAMLAERDLERWEMLKRVAYIQRVLSKLEQELKEENIRREKLGLEKKVNPLANVDMPIPASNIYSTTKAAEETNNLSVPTPDRKISDATLEHKGMSSDLEEQVSAEQKGVSNSADTNAAAGASSASPAAADNRDIPITSLTDAEIDDLFENVLKIEKARFIDPYSFQDPLDDEFYEDLWFENAYRNTRIFRLVFHCQPDNAVTNWNEYKEYHKLMEAFSLAQEYEIDAMKKYVAENDIEQEDEAVDEQGGDSDVQGENGEEFIYGSAPNSSHVGDGAFSRPNMTSHKTSRSIRLSDLERTEIGGLGMPPEEGRKRLEQQQQQLNGQAKKEKLKKKLNNFRKGGSANDQAGYEEENFADTEEDNESLYDNGVTTSSGTKSGATNMINSTIAEDVNENDGKAIPSTDRSRNNSLSANTHVNGNGEVKSISHNSVTKTNSIPSALNSSGPYKNLRSPGVSRRRAGTLVARRHKNYLSRPMIFDMTTAEKLLSEISGHLVMFPVNWLYKELENDNWFTNSDRLPPIEIFD